MFSPLKGLRFIPLGSPYILSLKTEFPLARIIINLTTVSLIHMPIKMSRVRLKHVKLRRKMNIFRGWILLI